MRSRFHKARCSAVRTSLAVTCFVAFLGVKYANAYRERSKLDTIPTVGPDGILSSYYTAWRYMLYSGTIIEEGCRKYPDRIFKIPTLSGWKVIVNGQKLVDDIRRASEEELSIVDASEDTTKGYYTISPTIHTNPYHIDVIRTPFTRNINARFDDVWEEIIAAFDDNIPTKDYDWIEVPTAKTVRNIIVRASNRFFVGLPLCRDPDYCDLNIQYTINVVINAEIISSFPEFLHPIVGRIFTKKNESRRRALKHLGPVIEERLRMQQEHGSEWVDKPNDFISWLIDAMEDLAEDWQKGSVEDLAIKVMDLNFASIHTTSMSFTFALNSLAANPHLAEPLRKEVETVIGQEGWTKPAMVKLRLMDSFLKETLRRNAGPLAINRVARKNFKFSDGTVVPAGATIGVASDFIHHDETIYPNPSEFNGSRFSDLRDKEGEGIKHQMVTLTANWLNFGIGKHAWYDVAIYNLPSDSFCPRSPGRFFAVNEMKGMLAYVLLNYDVKFEDNAPCPRPVKFVGLVGPDESAKVMFRRRINTSTL